MLARRSSLRWWLLVAMVTSAGVGLIGAVILYGQLTQSSEHAADAAKARDEAAVIATQVRSGAGTARLTALQDLLGNDEITIERFGRVVFRGPRPHHRTLELRVAVPMAGGVVRLADYSSPGPSNIGDLTLVTAGVLLLVIGAGIVTATLVTRSVRVPVERAIAVAAAVAAGDFSARMGAVGPEELVKLGFAFDGMAERLERADADQRRFLADVVHEIATPVNTISGFGLALAEGVAVSEEERRQAKALIEGDTRRLQNLLVDLRELTQLDLTEGVRPGEVALAPLVRELAARFRTAAEAAGVTITVGPREYSIVTDTRLFELVASNLISNAIRYTPSGGHVRLGLRRRRGAVVLSVKDTGIGIAPEYHRRIFERLYRVDDARDRATGGSGLGLSIAQRAAQTLGGRIELTSSPGQGSEFRLIVPTRP